jgi:glutamate-1-semialdehyde aminotransferase
MTSVLDDELLRRAASVTPGASQTNSRRHGKVGTDNYPAFAVRGKGAMLTLQDGRTVIDLAGANGAVPLGYEHPEVSFAIQRYSNHGGTLSLPSPLEIEVSEQMCAVFDSDVRVRWVRTGSEAVSAAVSIAQEKTGSEIIGVIGEAYHGWHPWTRQVIKLGIVPLLNGETFDLSECAAILVESPRWESVSEPMINALQELRERCTDAGALLIFDDVVYGFRFAAGGLQETSGVKPDLACFSKALGNGTPVGCVVGNHDLMTETGYRVSSTFGGEVTGLAAASGVLSVHADRDVCGELLVSGTRLRQRLDAALHKSPIKVVGQPQHFRFTSDSHAILDEFLSGCITHRDAVLIHRDANNFNLAIDSDIEERIVATVSDIAERLPA